MSAKMSPATKTKAVPKTTKTGPKSTKVTEDIKLGHVRLNEDDKKAQPEIYILNPNTEKWVKRDTPNGKKLEKAEKTGEEVPKTITDTQRLILVVETLRDSLNLDDDAIKEALKTIGAELPRGFPAIWGGKQKTARNPDRPKNPSNPYILFTSSIRESTKKANPGMQSKELMSVMSDIWIATSKEDRLEYEEAAAVDLARYEREMVVFETKYPDEARAKSSPNKPTKKTAYHCYCDERREALKLEFQDKNGKEITKLLAEQWDDLKLVKEEVDKYQAMADEANEGFADRVSEYHSSPGSPVKLSKAEQVKANDPENFELNVETGRYVRKEKPKSPKSPKSPVKAKAKAKVVPKIAKKVEKVEDEENIPTQEEEDDESMLIE
jgi:high mobility group protein B2